MILVLTLVGCILVLIATGVPISLALVLASAGVFVASGVPLETVAVSLFNALLKYHLLAVPMFIIMGHILTESGLAQRLIALANSLVGFMRGGLGMVNIVTSMIMAEMSGAGTADAAVMSKIFVPSMVKAGYDRGFSAAVTSASASLGIIIPPSIAMILLGLYTDISVAKLFMAGIIPGVMLAGFQMLVCYLIARRRNYPIGGRFSIGDVLHQLRGCWFVFLVPLVILGSIFTGLATVTESAVLGLVLVIVSGLTYGRLSPRRIMDLFSEGVRQSAVITMIVGSSALIAVVFADQRVAYDIVDTLSDTQLPNWALLLAFNALLVLLGTFLHGTATIIIVAPLFLPLALEMGVHPIQYGMIILMSQAIGQQTPPVASVLLTVASVSETPIEDIVPTLMLFLVAFVVLALFVTFFPQISLFLPTLFA